MNFNNFTIKASEAIQSAHTSAVSNQHNQIDTIHLMIAMLQQTDGFVPMIINTLAKDKA